MTIDEGMRTRRTCVATRDGSHDSIVTYAELAGSAHEANDSPDQRT